MPVSQTPQVRAEKKTPNILSRPICIHFPLKCLSTPRTHSLMHSSIGRELPATGIRNQHTGQPVLKRVRGSLHQSKNIFYFKGKHSQQWLKPFLASPAQAKEKSLLSLVPCKRRVIILSRSYIELDSSLSDFSPQLFARLLLYRRFLLLWLVLGVLFNKTILKANSFIALWIETSTPTVSRMQTVQFSINCFTILPPSS